jgi:outer membrane protein TolC
MRQRLGSITGTLKKQDYEIKKLSFDLAQKQFQDGEISKTHLDQQHASYQKSARDLKTFLNSSRIAD